MADFWASLDRLHAAARRHRWLGRLAILTRVLLALGFTPSGYTKLVGHRFTTLPVSNPVGFIFEALYQSGSHPSCAAGLSARRARARS